MDSFPPDELLNIRTLLEELSQETLPEWERLAPHIQRVTAETGTLLFEQGEVYPFIALMMEGYIELLASDLHGGEWVISIAEPGQLVGSIPALRPAKMQPLLDLMPAYSQIYQEMTEGVSTYTARVIAPSVLIRVPFAELEAMAADHTEWGALLLRQVYLFASLKELRHREFLTLSPLERYERFRRDRANLLTVVTKRSIASMLGITPESLSRILGRLATRTRE